jgi:hypothetical protein
MNLTRSVQVHTYLYVRHNSQPQTIFCNHQHTKVNKLQTFLPVSGLCVAVETLHMCSSTACVSYCRIIIRIVILLFFFHYYFP